MSVAPRIPAKLNPQFDCQALWNFEGNHLDTSGQSPPANFTSDSGSASETFTYAQDHTGAKCLLSRGENQALLANTGITRLRIYGDITVQAVVWYPNMIWDAGGAALIQHVGSSTGAFDTENWLYALGGTGLADRLVPQFYWESSQGVFEVVRDETFTLDPGRWYHQVGVRDGTEARLYVNGRLIKTEVGVAPSSSGTNGRARVGKDDGNNRGLQKGTMLSSAKISNRALTAGEITQEYNRVRGSV